MAEAATRATALWVVRRLREAGHQALFAGGCVRDMLLGRPCHDFDVATDAAPQQVKRLFGRVLLIGAKFGVAMVLHNRRKVEVTTFRSDLSYTDGRRPDGVRFATPREDALRRDFTINGMFYDPIARRVIDYVGGQEDLRAGVIRTIGRPADRFAEDYLRMIRAVRFAVRLGFRVEPATAEAIRRHAPKVASISGERIHDELTKMLAHDSAGEAVRLLHELGLLRAILPELYAPADAQTAAHRRVQVLARRRDPVLALGALLMDLPAETVSAVIRRWGASNELRDALKFFAEHRDGWRQAADLGLAQFKRLMAGRQFARLRALWAVRERLETHRAAQARRIARRAAGIAPQKVHPPPLVTGADLKDMGLTEGPLLGRILRELYDAQLNEVLTSRKEALAAAKAKIGSRLMTKEAPGSQVPDDQGSTKNPRAQ
jgi:poly(A) polymerase